MKKIFLLLSILLLSVLNGFSQNNLWRKTTIAETSSIQKMDRASMPNEFQLFSLNINDLKNQLQNAPLDLSNTISNVVIQFPNPEGTFDSYKIYESPIMEKGLSDKFPDIKSYTGKGIEDPTATIRFSVTLFGLHTMTLSGKSETAFIDTYTKDLSNYIVYKKSSVLPAQNFHCMVNDTNKFALDNTQNNTTSILRASDGKFRIFRLAMACTIEYAAFHVSAAGVSGGTLTQKKAAVLAAMGVTMTRVNGVYERDMSLRMNLIANNDLIIFITSDNFTDNDAVALIDESQAQITSIIGSANFDIGHTVSTGGGGYAGPYPCDNATKASGITGSSAPVGDPYDIDYVAHEMGHQYGANHSFRNSCQGNVNGSTAVEPGSGSTIMGYAGICPPDVQSNSDSYFHAVSIAEMVAQINSVSTCAAITLNNNAAPVVNAGLDYTIPKGTAYVLTGSATDTNNPSTLTYCWEQLDTQSSTQPPTQTATGGPNFRSWAPTTSPSRYMPKLGATTTTWEVLPNVARTLHFALTVRDNASPLGGQTARGSDILVNIVNTAGPLIVTSQATTGISWSGNTNQTITWNVAGTNANGINVTNVKILLSTDNGVTFPTTLLATTANDGTEIIVVPNTITSTNCRLMVQAIGNIFYAVNTTKFTITPSLATDNFGLDHFILYPNPNNGNFNISFDANSNEVVNVAVNDIRGRKIYSKTFTNSGLFQQELQLDNIQSGVYLVTVQNGERKEVKRIIVE